MAPSTHQISFYDRTREHTYSGELLSTVYTNEENGFSVHRFRVEDSKETITLVGILGNPQPGLTLTVTGRWEKNKRFGEQFRVRSFTPSDPRSQQGMVRFLSSGMIKGVGLSTAKKIVEAFKERTFHVLDEHPSQLTTVSGIGPKKASTIVESWTAHRHLSRSMAFLQGYGVGPRTAFHIVKRYGAQTQEILTVDPYRLAREIRGIGFNTADAIALSMGFAKDAPERIREALYFSLSKWEGEGHTYCDRHSLFSLCSKLLAPLKLDLSPYLALLAQETRVVIEGDRVYTARLHQAEAGTARELQRLLANPIQRKPLEKKAQLIVGEITLSREQTVAVYAAYFGQITIITGGPGTGKTTLIRALLELESKAHTQVALAAPTGRAAKRASQAAGCPAKTLHRLLEIDPRTRKFSRDHANPLKVDLLVVDEVSMVDLPLLYSLLKALPTGCRLVLVGDQHQLPSVGPGRVLQSLMESKTIPTFSLNTIYRQAAQSAIVRCSHELLHGTYPLSHGKGERGDLFFIKRDTPEAILKTTLHLVGERIPGSYGLDPFWEIQVLLPKHQGELGTLHFNTLLQETLNPKGAPFTSFGQEWRVGDKVLQTKNNYEHGIFNGDLGVITQRNEAQGTFTLTMDDRTLTRPLSELAELQLAYAISIHKSQGSEYPCVVLPLHTQHSIMLQRNLLYTAVTRARQVVVIVGSARALKLAISNSFMVTRNSFLPERLRQGNLT